MKSHHNSVWLANCPVALSVNESECTIYGGASRRDCGCACALLVFTVLCVLLLMAQCNEMLQLLKVTRLKEEERKDMRSLSAEEREYKAVNERLVRVKIVCRKSREQRKAIETQVCFVVR